MNIIRGLHNIKPAHRGAWLTMGNFDGLHLGHRAIVQTLQTEAAKTQAPTMVINFHPSPDTYFQPEQPKAKLMRLHEKLALLRQWGVDNVLLLPFNATLAALPAEIFIQTVLVNQLNMQGIVVGDDFRFGFQRQGHIQLLQEKAAMYAYQCIALPAQIQDYERVSSTRIREALTASDFTLAARLLGRPYSMSGRVRRGQARGRLLGFPTANIPLGRRTSPLLGVFAGWATLPDGTYTPAVANIGWRPTVGGTQAPLLEVHLLDHQVELYGKRLTMTFVSKLRDEQKFQGLEALQAQLHADVRLAREILSHDAALIQ